MKLELEGREPYIVLFGIPIVTSAIVLGSFYLGRMQAEVTSTPPIYVEPKIAVTPHVTAEFPMGSVRAEVQLPAPQIHEVIKEVVKVPDVNIVNKVEPTPIQVSIPPASVSPQTRFVVIPAPLPIPLTGTPEMAQDPAPETTTTVQTAPPETPPVVPPETVQPTPVSTDESAPVEPDVEGKLLPPPHGIGGTPSPQ